MACNVPPFASSVLAEASRIAPGRRTSSDGACADAAHYATGGDHVPSGPNQYTHAVDISHSVPGAPYWEPRFARFDAMAYAHQIAGRRDPRVKYMVANFGGPDMINSLDSRGWRQNGSYKTDHRSHLHVSFTVAAERSTAPFFMEADVPITAAERAAIVKDTVSALRAVIREECSIATRNALGGYDDSGKWIDGLLAAELRKTYGLTKP